MKKKHMIGKIIVNIFNVVSVLFLLWILLSFIEVFTNNLTPNYEYSNFNFFTAMMKLFNK